MKQHGLPRKAIALAVVTAAAWVMGQTADMGEASKVLFESGALVTHLLELELGKVLPDEQQPLQGLPALVVQQSPLLTQEVFFVEEVSTDCASLEEAAEMSEITETAERLTDPADDGQEAASIEAKSTQAVVSNSAETDKAEGAKKTKKKQDKEQDKKQDKEQDKEVFQAVDISKVSTKKIDISNHTERQSLKVEKYWNKKIDLALQPADKGAQILIIHTHATEAYRMADGDKYEESDESRTTDERYNMIRVGEEMKRVFEEQGLSVIHDKTTYDYPGYNGSYGRSLAGIQSILEENPTIQVVLDVHRDALIDSKGKVYDKTTTIDGEKVAQVMLVVGTDDGGLYHPNWRKNYTLSLKLQGAMLALDETLPRPIDLRSQRFNQHLRCGSVLVEVGTSGNTLQQALAGARYFAIAAGQIYTECITS